MEKNKTDDPPDRKKNMFEDIEKVRGRKKGT